MLDKQNVLDSLNDFKDGYGTSFASACGEEMSIIESALDWYYDSLKVVEIISNLPSKNIEKV